MRWLTRLAVWGTRKIGSFGVEVVSGLLLAGIAALLLDDEPSQVAVCLIASVLYEGMLDPNGWSWRDVGQRAVGIVGGVLGVAALR